MFKENEEKVKLINECEKELTLHFHKIEEIELENQKKVLASFIKNELAERHFIGSSGYGHEDIGKDITNKIFADIFHAESAYVSPLITSGTSAISHALLGILRPNDTMLCISGTPYDTLKDVIFGCEKDCGSLKDFGVKYAQIDLKNNDFDDEKIIDYLENNKVRMVYVQRSRGYVYRNALTVDQMSRIFEKIKTKYPDIIIMVDNCYGEFVERKEPTDVGADIIVGSLLKNPGGAIAPTGGYVIGKEALVDLVACHISSPAMGFDTGSYLNGYKSFLQGIFFAPHIVAESKKVALLTSKVMCKLGYDAIPKVDDTMADIVCSIMFNDKNKLIEFCRAIQNVSPVDSMAYLEPWAMPGYQCDIIMASGSFNQGSSIELSCDAPVRPPYVAYMQGSISYMHGKIALIHALSSVNL